MSELGQFRISVRFNEELFNELLEARGDPGRLERGANASACSSDPTRTSTRRRSDAFRASRGVRDFVM